MSLILYIVLHVINSSLGHSNIELNIQMTLPKFRSIITIFGNIKIFLDYETTMSFSTVSIVGENELKMR